MFSYTPSTQSQSDRRRTASSNVIGPTSYEAISWSIRESMSLSNGNGLSGSFTASANAIMALLRPDRTSCRNARRSASPFRWDESGIANGLR